MKNPPIWITACFKSRKIPKEDPQETLFLNKQVGVGFNIVKNAYYDENVKLKNTEGTKNLTKIVWIGL